MNTATNLPLFPPGFRMIQGESLNAMVKAIETSGPTIVSTGEDQTTELVSFYAALADPEIPGLNFTPGRYHYSGSPSSSSYVFDVKNIVGKTINGNGSTMVLDWDPLDPDGTIPFSYRFLNCEFLDHIGFTFDMDPSPFCQGTVTAVTGTTVTFLPADNSGNPDPSFAPAFRSADDILQVVPSQKNICANVQFDNAPGTLLPNVDGTFTYTPFSSAPVWAAPGQSVVLCCRKRAANLMFLRNVSFSKFDPVIRAASAVAIRCENLGDGNRIDAFAQGPGYLSCSAAICTSVDGRGTLNYSVVSYGTGDDVTNIGSARIWNTISFTSNTVTVSAWNTRTGPANGPMTPLIGDQIEIYSSTGLIVNTLLVTNVTGLTVTLSGNLPGGFDPTTWWLLNRNYVQVLRISRHQATGPSGRGLIPQSHDWEVGILINEGIRNVGLQGRNPASEAHTGDGGFKGGGQIGVFMSDWSNTAYATYGASVLDAFAFDADFNILTVDTGWEPVTIGTLIASNYGYGGIAVGGIKVVIGTCILQNGGASRGMLDPSRPGANDLWTSSPTGAQLVVGNLINLNNIPTQSGNVQTNPSGVLEASNNLSDVSNIATSRGNLVAAYNSTQIIANNWIPPVQSVASGSATMVANTLYGFLFEIQSPVTVDTLGIYIATGVSGAHVNFGVYSWGTGLQPLALLGYTLGLDASTSTTQPSGAINTGTLVLPAGLYLGVLISDSTPTVAAITTSDPGPMRIIGSSSLRSAILGGASITGVTGTGATYSGGFNALFGTATPYTSNMPIGAMRIH